MKVTCKVKINSKATHNELATAWTNEDYINILDLCGFSDELAEAEIKDMTLMALADQEPEESAELLLQYRLGEQLNEGQIQQLSHEMQQDKVSEEYADIFLHHELFNVNQLLFKAFNGRFPNSHATEVNLNIMVKPAELLEDEDWQNEIILKALIPAMGDHSVMMRLYEDEIAGTKKFRDADGIVWLANLDKQADGSCNVQLFSSEYWLDDLPRTGEYETTFKIVEVEEVEES